MQKNLGIPVKLIPASDYSAVIEAMRTKKAEIGFFGPLSYVLATKEAGVEAFAAAAPKGGDGSYHSIITVLSKSPYKTWADLKGKRIALVDPASTSGSLMPHLMVLQATGMELEKYFSKVLYCGTHPGALKALVNGTVDVAAVEERLSDVMEQKGLIPVGSVRELTRSEVLPPSPFAFRTDMDPQLKEKIRAAVLAIKDLPLNTSNIDMDHCRPISDADYKVVADLVDKLKLQRDKILSK